MKQVGSKKNNNTARSVVSALLQPATRFASASVVGALAITSLWPLSEALAQQQCTPSSANQTCVNSLTLSGGAIGINDTSTLTLTNNTSTGKISGTVRGINAVKAIVQGNDGTIEATDTAGRAIGTSGDADVANGSGTIQANGTSGAAIGALGTATVINGSGTIQANGQGGTAIIANIVNVTGNSGTIQATGVQPADLDGIAILAQASGSVHNIVHNLANGTIKGGNIGIASAASSIFFDVTNDAGATISGGSKGISLQGLNINTVTNAGTISGTAASVEFLGAGTNVLTLKPGSVLIGDAIGSTASANNQLILQGALGTANNNFRGFNSLEVQGSWLLNGSADVQTATIDPGFLLKVGDGSTAVRPTLTGNVTVNADAELRGVGIIAGNVDVLNGGTLAISLNTAGAAPNDVGTMDVNGNVRFAPTSAFRINVNGDGTHDKLSVGGTAALSGTVNVRAGGTFAPTTQYTILTATGGLSGTFNNVTSSLPFLSPSLTYDVNNVFLTLDLISVGGGGGGGTTSTGSVFVGAAQTRNQIAVAGALDAGVAGATPVTNPLLLALLNLPSAVDARQAFDSLSGEVFGTVQNTQATHMHFTREAMLGRMRQASYYYDSPNGLGALSFGGPELAYASGDAGTNSMAAVPGKAPVRAAGPSRDLTFWAQGLGGWGHADSDGNAASVRSRFGGFLSGADVRLSETWRAGLVAGYMRTNLNVDDRSSSAGIDSVQFGGYASGKLGAFNVRGGASYSYDKIDTSRGIVFPGFIDQASAHFHGNVGQVFGEVGYGMALGQVALEPLAGLAYVDVRDDSFAESGGLAALSATSTSQSTSYSTLGLRAATAVPLANGTVLIPRGSLQWQYTFGDVTPVTALAFQSTGTSFTVAGIPIARNTALIEGGFDWRFSPQAKLGAYYQGELAAHAESHAFKGALTWDF